MLKKPLILSALALIFTFFSFTAAFAGIVYSEPDGIDIMVVSGSWYEMGYQVGSEKKFHPIILNGIKHITQKYGAEKFTDYYEKVKSILPVEITDQIAGTAKGLSDSADIDYETAFQAIVAWNFVFDVVNLPAYHCSALAVSEGENKFLIHNTDQQYGGEGGASIIIYKPDENSGNAFVSYFGPQFIGVALGANKHGLSVVYNTTRQKGATFGMPVLFMTQIIMNKARNIDDAVKLCRDFLRSGATFGHSAANFTVMDFVSDKMARIEVSSNRIEVEEGIEHKPGGKWVASTNHYIKMSELCPELPASSVARFKSIMRLSEECESFDIPALAGIFSDHGIDHCASGNSICVHKTKENTKVQTVLTHIFDADYNIYWSSGQPCSAVERLGGMRRVNWMDILMGKNAEPGLIEFSTLKQFVPEGYVTQIRDILVQSGNNAPELLRAIDYFHSDSVKQKAVCYLIMQTPYRCFRAIDKDKMEIEPVRDVESITSEILIDTIELGFAARDKYPWAKEVPVEEFFRFVLAYRGTGEKLENWRRAFWEDPELKLILESYIKPYESASRSKKSEIFREMIWKVNSEWIGGKVRYAPRGLPDYSPAELLEVKTGRCTDLVNFQCAVLRAYGIAVTGTREVWWPDAASNHYWTTIYSPSSGKWFDVDAAAVSPFADGYFDGYKFTRRHGKVYRLAPGEENGCISGFYRRQSPVSDWAIENYLIDLPMLDVTSEYTKTAAVSSTGFAAKEFVYLSVFNNDGWCPIAGSIADNSGCLVFNNVGCEDVLYSFVTIETGADGEEVVHLRGRPFILHENGEMQYISGMPDVTHEAVVEKLAQDADLTLLMWKNTGWREAGNLRTDEAGRAVCNLSSGVLYIIMKQTDTAGENAPSGSAGFATRPFLLDNNNGEYIISYY
ncbi:MAG: hypothetical protein HZA48_01000 [Planctomycetes bacterium]|nr:hypothetical protein [Planctomycetota bacterium]